MRRALTIHGQRPVRRPPAESHPNAGGANVAPSDRPLKDTAGAETPTIEKLAIRTQCNEIRKFQAKLSLELGRDVSPDEAARLWIPAFASQWREEFEAGMRLMRAPIAAAASLPVKGGNPDQVDE